MPVQLDQVRSFDRAQVRSGVALLNPQQQLERIEGVAVHIKGVHYIRHDRPTPEASGSPEKYKRILAKFTGTPNIT